MKDSGTNVKLLYEFAVQIVEEEGKHAIDSPGSPLAFSISPEEYDLGESLE